MQQLKLILHYMTLEGHRYAGRQWTNIDAAASTLIRYLIGATSPHLAPATRHWALLYSCDYRESLLTTLSCWLETAPNLPRDHSVGTIAEEKKLEEKNTA